MIFPAARFRKILNSLTLISLELIAVLTLFICCFAGFVYIVNNVLKLENQAFDVEVFDLVAPHVNVFNTRVALFFTFLGSRAFLLPANIALVYYFLFLQKNKKYAVAVLVISLGTVIINSLLKSYFGRMRPPDPILSGVEGFSFPSGHAMSGLTFYGLLIYLIGKHSGQKGTKRILIIFLFLTIISIGFSRIYLRVHYASDVIAGFAAAIVWMMLSLWAIRKVEGYPRITNQPANEINIRIKE